MRARWLALGAMYGFAAGMAARGFVDRLEAISRQYVRAPGSPVVVRLDTGRRIHP